MSETLSRVFIGAAANHHDSNCDSHIRAAGYAPNNNELRAQQATLSDFVHHTIHMTPDFPPGTNSRYSSMGFAVLAVIIEQLTNASVHNLLAERLFTPLSMRSSWLDCDC